MLVHLRRSLVMAVICMVVLRLRLRLRRHRASSQVLFKHQANGSITANGSTLIGQNWSEPKWFHGRPDDTGPYACNAKTPSPAAATTRWWPTAASGESGATSLGPRSKALLANTKALVAYWHALGVNPTVDLVTTSGSGYDPDISPADALVQIPMVAKATGRLPAALRALDRARDPPGPVGLPRARATSTCCNSTRAWRD